MLEVSSLSVSYGRINAVRDISFQVGDREIVSLIGANGAGKTTTLKTISGLLKAKSGSVRFDGEEILGAKPPAIVGRGIVHVPEGRQVFSQLTVEENLILGGFLIRQKSELDKRVRKAYELFPILEERKHQKAGSLSGGEQQMLAIGRGLVSGAKILLLDEPSLGLAPIVVQEVFQVIQQLRESGISILLIEQNASEAMAISDRTYIMETGEIVLEGKSEEVAQDPNVKSIYLGGDI